MNHSRYRGTLWDRAVWDRAALRWTGPAPSNGDAIDIFTCFREAKKILILPSDRVGGLFIGAPFYSLVRQTYPDAQVDLFVEEKKASIARQIPFVDRVVTGVFDVPVWSASFKEVVDRLRQQQYDLSLCLGADCSFRLAHLCGVSGARLRVGFQRHGIEPFNVEVVQRNKDVYEGDQYRSMLQLFGIEGEPNVQWAIARENAQQVRSRYIGEDHSNIYVVGVDLASGEGDGLSIKQLDSLVGRIIERGAVAVLFFPSRIRKRSVILMTLTADAYDHSNRAIYPEWRLCWKAALHSYRATPNCYIWGWPLRFPWSESWRRIRPVGSPPRTTW